MIDDETSCTKDKLNNNGIFNRYGIAFIKGILYKIIYKSCPIIDIRKNKIDKNIDCKI